MHSKMATDALVLKHQAISMHIADQRSIMIIRPIVQM